MTGDVDDIRSRLEAIAEELGDLAIERLRDAVERGGSEPAMDERRLSRARRAVEMAAAVLRDDEV